MPADEELTHIDYNTCIMAVRKCQLLYRAVKVGLPCTLTKDNFGFPDLTDEEEYALIQKLSDASDLAWLKQQPKDV